MNKRDKKVRVREWQVISSNAIAAGCRNYRWELGKVGKKLKAVFIENATKKKEPNNVIDLAEVSKKSA